MKTLVTYLSMTGNTKKIADRVFNNLAGEKKIYEVDKVENHDNFDLIILAFPILNFGIPKQVENFIMNIESGKKAALCITHAMGEKNPMLKDLLKTCSDAAEKLDLIDTFSCRGELSEEVASFLKKHDNPQMRAFGDSRPETMGYPKKADLDNATAFAHKLNKELNL